MEVAFKELFENSFETFFDGLHRYAYTLLKGNDEASDAVQAVFAKWWENKTSLEGLEAAKAYLFTAVYRQCLNSIRDKKVKQSHAETYFHEQGSGEAKFEDLPAFEELDIKIKLTIDSLPAQCKIIFHKSRFEEKRYAQIAKEMNLSVKTVEAQIGKALKILREKLEGYR